MVGPISGEMTFETEPVPEAMLRICPGYRSAGGGEPVAPVRRVKRRHRGAERRVAEFPGGDAAHLSGLLARRRQ